MEGRDEDRSLTKKGWREADAIAGPLADAGIERISPAPTRDAQSVKPLAKLIKAPVEISPLLAEEPDIDAAYALIDGLIGTNAVVCSHGDVAPALINRMMWAGPCPRLRFYCSMGYHLGGRGGGVGRGNSPTPTTGRHPKSDQPTQGASQTGGIYSGTWTSRRAICSSG